ncbi:O-antigen ligase family protein [Candidatus Wolfebacteria bacterium]|nr:O-antigen ligase family protein [Candidatus Wolfebacteria bacterium]
MIDKIQKWALLAPAFIPLVYIDLFFYPLVAPKAFFFRIVITIAILSITYLAIKGKGLYTERLRSVWAWIPLLLLVVAYITSYLGIDFYHSFWSVFDRSAGLLALTYGTSYLYLLLLTVSKEFMWKFFVLTAGTASLVAVYTIIQWLGEISGISIPGILETNGRIGSTIGNAAFLAGYLGLTFFITLIVAKKSVRHEEYWYAASVLQLIAIVLAATRGTILALLAVFGIALIYTSLKGEGKVKKIAIGGLVASLIFTGGFFTFREEIQKIPFEPIARIAQISKEDATTSSRLFVWKHTFAAALERPLKGYGAEHIDYVFNSFYNAQDIVEQWFDRSHNLYLDYLIQYGVFGLLLFILFIVQLFRFAFATRKEDEFTGNMLILLVGTYVLQSVFVFDTINTLVVLFPLFAFGFIRSSEQVKNTSGTKVSLGIIAVISIVGIYVSVLQPAYANLQLGSSYLQHVVDVQEYKISFEKGLAGNSFVDLEFGYQAYSMYTARQQNLLSGEEKIIAYSIAKNILGKNAEKYPYDARTLVYLGHVIEARPSGVAYSQEENEKILFDSLILSPSRAQAYYMLANIYIGQGNDVSGQEKEAWYTKATDIVEKYRVLAPRIAEPYFVLAELYRVTGNPQKAEEFFAAGIERYDEDPADARRIAGHLLSQNKITEARPYLETVLIERPEDYVAIFDLAKVRFLDGDIDGAVELVELIQLEQREILNTDTLFLQSLQNALQ